MVLDNQPNRDTRAFPLSLPNGTLVDHSISYREQFGVQESNNLTVVDLFSGCGGLSLGFQRAGFCVSAGVDNDRVALKTYAANLQTNVLNADLSGSEWLATLEGLTGLIEIDVLIGGPPCQGYSLTGTREANDPRNGLYEAMFKAIRYFHPRFVLIENVRGMLSLYGGRAVEDVLMRLRDLQYEVDYRVLNSADFGVPQVRERLFILASTQGYAARLPNPFVRQDKHLACKEAISDLPPLIDDLGDDVVPYQSISENEFQEFMRSESNYLYNHVATDHRNFVKDTIALVPDGGNFKNLPPGWGESRKFNEAWTRYNSKLPSRTIDTGHRNHFHYKWNRVPTVRENARLQTFPDNFRFYGTKTQQNKQVGNAVPVLLAQAIASKILEELMS